VPDDALMEVVYRALKDEVFFKALSKDPVTAAKNAGIPLSSEDEEKLRRAMDGPAAVTLDLPHFLHEARAKLVTPEMAFRWVGFSWADPYKKHDR
jgi:hypothetical protein